MRGSEAESTNRDELQPIKRYHVGRPVTLAKVTPYQAEKNINNTKTAE